MPSPTAYDDGFASGYTGDPTPCPYHPDSAAGAEWWEGYHEGWSEWESDSEDSEHGQHLAWLEGFDRWEGMTDVERDGEIRRAC